MQADTSRSAVPVLPRLYIPAGLGADLPSSTLQRIKRKNTCFSRMTPVFRPTGDSSKPTTTWTDWVFGVPHGADVRNASVH